MNEKVQEWANKWMDELNKWTNDLHVIGREWANTCKWTYELCEWKMKQ